MPAKAMFDPFERAISFGQRIPKINCYVEDNPHVVEFDIQTSKNDFELQNSSHVEFIGTGKISVNHIINPRGGTYNFWRVKR